MAISEYEWMTGFECSAFPQMGMDELELTQHDRFWASDLLRVRETQPTVPGHVRGVVAQRLLVIADGAICIAGEQALKWGVPEIRLYTNARMERNIALYTAYGFRETGRRERSYRSGWIVVDMAKPVSK